MTTELANWRDARDARALCEKMGALCAEHSEGVVCAALSGLVSMLDPMLQLHLMQSIAERTVTLELPPETETAIEKIVKGIT